MLILRVMLIFIGLTFGLVIINILYIDLIDFGQLWFYLLTSQLVLFAQVKENDSLIFVLLLFSQFVHRFGDCFIEWILQLLLNASWQLFYLRISHRWPHGIGRKIICALYLRWPPKQPIITAEHYIQIGEES